MREWLLESTSGSHQHQSFWGMKGMKTVKRMKVGVSPASQAGDEETAG